MRERILCLVRRNSQTGFFHRVQEGTKFSCSCFADALVDLPFFIYLLHHIFEVTNVFAVTQEQVTVLIQSKMKFLQDVLLQHRVHVNEHVPAGKKVDLAERRIPGDIMLGKYHHFTELGSDLVIIAFLQKIFGKPFWLHLL